MTMLDAADKQPSRLISFASRLQRHATHTRDNNAPAAEDHVPCPSFRRSGYRTVWASKTAVPAIAVAHAACIGQRKFSQ